MADGVWGIAYDLKTSKIRASKLNTASSLWDEAYSLSACEEVAFNSFVHVTDAIGAPHTTQNTESRLDGTRQKCRSFP